LRHTLDLEREITLKEVVDGQQRCRSIIEFKDNRFSSRHSEHSRRVYYRDLTAPQRHQFLMAKLPIAQLIGADDADVIEIFGRLNAVAKTLNAQEKRAAQYSGEFHQFCLKQAVEHLPIWRNRNIFSATQISRMQEVQFVADLTLSMLNGITDFQAQRITKAYKEWDEDFPEKLELVERFERIYEHIAAIRPEVFRDTIFSRSPVFYSLVLVLDSQSKLPSTQTTKDRLIEIDSRFNDPRPSPERPERDLVFVRRAQHQHNAFVSALLGTSTLRRSSGNHACLGRHCGCPTGPLWNAISSTFKLQMRYSVLNHHCRRCWLRWS
jgi:hypothetical protein